MNDSLPLFGLNTQPLVFDQRQRHYLLDGAKVVRVTEVLQALDKSFRIPWALKEMAGYIDKNWDHSRIYLADEKKKIIQDSKGTFERVSMHAMDRGTRVHAWIEEYIGKSNPPKPTDPELIPPINSFLKWEKEHRVEWLASEFIIASKTHQYAGTIDFIAIVDDSLVIGDFKVSSRISLEYFLQTAAYQIALEELIKETFYQPNNVSIPRPMNLLTTLDLQNLHLLWNFHSANVPPEIGYRLILRIPADGSPVQDLKVPTDLEWDRRAFLGACDIHRWYKHAKDRYKQRED